MTRARNIAGFSTITTTPSPVHVGPIGVLTATRIDGEFNQVDLATRNITAAGIAATNLQVSGITTGLNVSGIITAQNGINFNGTSTGLNVSGVGTIATLSVTGNATVGGVLTYEDVTRVDSVGVVTARGLSIFGNTTGLNATGVSTFTGDLNTNTINITDTIAHTGDLNTKIRFPTADTITAETAGSERLRITSAGKVGVNITSPRSLLDLGLGTDDTSISNTAADYQLGLHAAQSTTGDIGRNIAFISQTQGTVCAAINSIDDGTTDRTALQFVTGNSTSISEKIRIRNTGEVGIGTVSPGGLFHTHTASGTNRNFIEASASHAFLRLKGGSTSYNSGLEFYSGASNIANVTGQGGGGLFFEVGGSERLRISSAGEVRVNGDGSGAGYLRVIKDRDTTYSSSGGNAQDLIVQQFSDGTNSGGYSALALQANYTGQTGAWVAIHAVRTGVGAADLTINPRNNTTGDVERVRIGSDGLVQIDQGTAGGNHLKIKNDEMSLLFGVNGTGDTYEREGFIGSTRNDSGSLPLLRLAGQGGIKFAVDANTVRATLTSSGQFLFDTSTAFTSVAYRKIQIGQSDGGWINLARTAVPSSGNHVGAIQGFTKSSDGNYHDTVAMDFKADGTQSNSSKGTIIEFYTTPESSTTKTLAASINREGKFRTYHTTKADEYATTHHGWAVKQYFTAVIRTDEHRWYKMVNYAAGAMLIGEFVFFSTRNGGFNQTKGFHTVRVSYNGYNNAIYGSQGSDSGNLSTGHAAGVVIDVRNVSGVENVYMEVPDSIYGGRIYGYFEGIINNWQFDESTYTNSAP